MVVSTKAPAGEFPKRKKEERPSLRRRFWHRLLIFERPVLWAFGRFFILTMHVFMRTTRVDRRGPFWDYLRRREPCIVTFWHEDAFTSGFELMWHAGRGYPCYGMVSAGRIGAVGDYLFGLFKIQCVRGSRRQSGVQAVEQLIEMVRAEPRAVLMTADGSRGPSREARWGALHLARETGLPIVAVRGWSERKMVFRKTWMKLAAPLPWGRRVVLSAEPMFIPPDADKAALEAYRRDLEGRMNEMAEVSVKYFRRGEAAVAKWGGSVRLR